MVKAVKPVGDKTMRFNAQTATIENGFVYLPRDAAWLADYLREITTFPGSKYDDQADSTAQALAWINQMAPEPGILTYMRMEVARMRKLEGVPIAEIAEEVKATPELVEEWLRKK